MVGHHHPGQEFSDLATAQRSLKLRGDCACDTGVLQPQRAARRVRSGAMQTKSDEETGVRRMPMRQTATIEAHRTVSGSPGAFFSCFLVLIRSCQPAKLLTHIAKSQRSCKPCCCRPIWLQVTAVVQSTAVAGHCRCSPLLLQVTAVSGHCCCAGHCCCRSLWLRTEVSSQSRPYLSDTSTRTQTPSRWTSKLRPPPNYNSGFRTANSGKRVKSRSADQSSETPW